MVFVKVSQLLIDPKDINMILSLKKLRIAQSREYFKNVKITSIQ
jgi:hypothetical protein